MCLCVKLQNAYQGKGVSCCRYRNQYGLDSKAAVLASVCVCVCWGRGGVGAACVYVT